MKINFLSVIGTLSDDNYLYLILQVIYHSMHKTCMLYYSKGDDNDSSIIGTECPMRNESDEDTGPVREKIYVVKILVIIQ